MPISIYLAEAILHSSQLVSKDQSSLVLERMPTSLSNLSCSNTTRFFHFIGFTEPCWWSWLQYEPFSKKTHILLWTLQKQFQVVFLIRDKAVMFWEYYHLLQQLPWGWVYAEFTMTNKIPNKQTTVLTKLHILLHQGAKFSKAQLQPFKEWLTHSYLHERSCKETKAIDISATSNIKC